MSARNTSQLHQIRIIGGRWRGRRITVSAGAGLRPTPDRVRETLFNWLAPHIRGARCLDLFAGTGALGIEALSRGAAEVCLVDVAHAATAHLQRTLATLDARAQVVNGDALALLSGGALGGNWDIVFVDPPYKLDCQLGVLEHLTALGVIAAGARVYVESASALDADAVAPAWELLRAKSAGQVRYHLLARKPPANLFTSRTGA